MYIFIKFKTKLNSRFNRVIIAYKKIIHWFFFKCIYQFNNFFVFKGGGALRDGHAFLAPEALIKFL